MKASNGGIKLIQGFEGLRLKAYQDSVGVWTIGYGHTGPDVTPGQVITQAQADALLARDLERFEAGVARLVKVPLNQNQFDALVCFSFNLGLGALQGSTLLRLLNAGDYAGAAVQFPRWNKAGGKELPGLTRRRAAEQSLFQAA
ncbi:lysozyme [Chromobacterium haemolyticum]|uniref:lysozyme n=1 Tax=Chromobacterium haemolyticum TaxID=394935 RepID=UPI0009D9F056|nr:lysozyme [Chromobacterium haemolyticum]OQS41126.1 muraminidase [Chromobacterium haemolyticum]